MNCNIEKSTMAGALMQIGFSPQCIIDNMGTYWGKIYVWKVKHVNSCASSRLQLWKTFPRYCGRLWATLFGFWNIENAFSLVIADEWKKKIEVTDLAKCWKVESWRRQKSYQREPTLNLLLLALHWLIQWEKSYKKKYLKRQKSYERANFESHAAFPALRNSKSEK